MVIFLTQQQNISNVTCHLAPTHGGMARLSWPGWLVTYRNGLPVCLR